MERGCPCHVSTRQSISIPMFSLSSPSLCRRARRRGRYRQQMFVFQFVNSYCSLLYVGFWLRDLKRLRQLLMTMMIVKQFVGQIVEKYKPAVALWKKNRDLEKNVRQSKSMFVVVFGIWLFLFLHPPPLVLARVVAARPYLQHECHM